MLIDLRATWATEGRRITRRAAERLRTGRGVGGRSLAPKAKPDGRPLGGHLVAVLDAGAVQVRADGFSIDYGSSTALEVFHAGNSRHGQPARPVVGITQGERADVIRAARAEAVRQINAQLRRVR